jgi:hypothetical protein
MAWENDEYVRRLLDGREKWGTVLSTTAVAALLVFLWDHPHGRWLDFGPVIVGFFGSFYVLVVNSYYEQAEAIANARENTGGDSTIERIRARCWCEFVCQIGFLGWFNLMVPFAVGIFATLALLFGIVPNMGGAP